MSDETFSRILREAMDAHGLDKACELAVKVGMDESILSDCLRGHRVPSEPDLTRICAGLPGFDDRFTAARDRFELGAAPDEVESMRAARDEATTELRSSAESMRKVAEVFESIPDGRGRLGARGAATIESLLAGLEPTDAAELSPETPIHRLALAAKGMVETVAEDASAPDRELSRLRAVLKQALDKLTRDDRVQLAGAYRADNGTLLTDADFGLVPNDEAVVRMFMEALAAEIPPEELLSSWRVALSALVAQRQRERERAQREDERRASQA